MQTGLLVVLHLLSLLWPGSDPCSQPAVGFTSAGALMTALRLELLRDSCGDLIGEGPPDDRVPWLADFMGVDRLAEISCDIEGATEAERRQVHHHVSWTQLASFCDETGGGGPLRVWSRDFKFLDLSDDPRDIVVEMDVGMPGAYNRNIQIDLFHAGQWRTLLDIAASSVSEMPGRRNHGFSPLGFVTGAGAGEMVYVLMRWNGTEYIGIEEYVSPSQEDGRNRPRWVRYIMQQY